VWILDIYVNMNFELAHKKVKTEVKNRKKEKNTKPKQREQARPSCMNLEANMLNKNTID